MLHQSGVLLGGLVHMTHGLTNLCHSQGLLVAGGADFSHDVRDPADRRHDLGHGGPRLIDLRKDAERVMRQNFPNSRFYANTPAGTDRPWWKLW